MLDRVQDTQVGKASVRLIAAERYDSEVIEEIDVDVVKMIFEKPPIADFRSMSVFP
jgi:hypothetical protein